MKSQKNKSNKTKMKTTQLNTVKKIARKSALPIIDKHVGIFAGHVIATDLETFARIKLPADKYSTTGSGVVPVELLSHFAKNSGHVKYDFTAQPGSVVVTVDGQPAGTYAAQSADDFPAFEFPHNFAESNGGLTSDQVSGLIDFMSKDDFKPALRGIYYNGEAQELCSTNAHILRVMPADFSGESFIIPAQTAHAIKAAKNDFRVYTEINSVKVEIVYLVSLCGTVILRFRPIDEIYPDYRAVIPTGYESEIKISKRELMRMLETVKPALNKNTKQVVLTVESGNRVSMAAEDIDIGNEITVPATCETNKLATGYKIGFNANYLKAMATNTAGELITFSVDNPNRAAICDDKLIMPVMLHE